VRVKLYEPEYLMASTPQVFGYLESDAGARGEGWPTATTLIDEVMIPVAKKLGLPLAMKFGACRGMQPHLVPCGGGDGVTVAVSVLLCTVTFYANLAHSLTRSPHIFDDITSRTPRRSRPCARATRASNSLPRFSPA
jgi:hypothetical protein